MADPSSTSPTPPTGGAPVDKMTTRQWLGNYVGLGYFGNTAVAISTVNFFKKVTPGIFEKMVSHYEKGYLKRQEAKILEPLGDKVSEEAKNAIREELKKEARAFGEKTAETRLLVTGGFAMAPFQSAKELRDYDQNKRKALTEAGGDVSALGERPKFSPLGKEASKNLPKWMVGRTLAIGAAFSVQRVVDNRFSKQKEAVDFALAKILTKVTGGAKKHSGEEPAESKGKEADGKATEAFKDDTAKAKSGDPRMKGINPKILKNVRMATSDAYMTAVAITTANFFNKKWDAASPDIGSKVGELRERFAQGFGRGK